MNVAIAPDAKPTAGRKPLSLTARLALLFALLAAGLLLLVGLLLERSIAAHFEELDEHDLNAKLTTIATLIAQAASPVALDELPLRLGDVLAGHDNCSAAGQCERRHGVRPPADLAHELSTPISSLMTETQVALPRSRSDEDYRNALMSNLEEFERIARMVSDMLLLAVSNPGGGNSGGADVQTVRALSPHRRRAQPPA